MKATAGRADHAAGGAVAAADADVTGVGAGAAEGMTAGLSRRNNQSAKAWENWKSRPSPISREKSSKASRVITSAIAPIGNRTETCATTARGMATIWTRTVAHGGGAVAAA